MTFSRSISTVASTTLDYCNDVLCRTLAVSLDKIQPAMVVFQRCKISSSSAGYLSWNSTGPTPTRTSTPTLAMRLSNRPNFVKMYTIAYRVQYTFTRVHARIPNGHPREDRSQENRACRTSRRTSRRGSSCVSGSDKLAALPQLTASYSRGKLNGRHADDPREDVGVRVGVGVVPVQFQL